VAGVAPASHSELRTTDPRKDTRGELLFPPGDPKGVKMPATDPSWDGALDAIGDDAYPLSASRTAFSHTVPARNSGFISACSR
jgi:hypothetical protein